MANDQNQKHERELPLALAVERIKRALETLPEDVAEIKTELNELAKQVKQIPQFMRTEPQPILGDMLKNGKWEVEQSHEFANRTSHILRNKETGERMAFDELKDP